MIHTKQELTQLFSLLYEQFHIPMFITDASYHIIASMDDFFQIQSDFFTTIFKTKLLKSSTGFLFLSEKENYIILCDCLEDDSKIVIGPILNHKIAGQDALSSYKISSAIISSYSYDQFTSLPSISQTFMKQYMLLYQLITGNEFDIKHWKTIFPIDKNYPTKQENALEEEIFQIRENPLHEFTYAKEQKIINYIKNEDSTNARLMMLELMQIKDGRYLSTEPFRSGQYKLICAITLYTRAVIDTGVPIYKAYTLSDIYIKKVDLCKNMNTLYQLSIDAIIDFTSLVKQYRNSQSSHWIKTCKNYIMHHLHELITLEQLANETHLNPSYLSHQFKKSTGQSIQEFIHVSRMKEAQYLIQNSNYSFAEIAEILQYSSQAHFTKMFKKVIGCTPTQYKNQRF